MRLSNPVESLDNTKVSEKYRPHGSKVRELLSEASLAALRRVAGK
jgi:hypothetical protein